MSTTRPAIEIQPRLMRATKAAAYLGMSERAFLELDILPRVHKSKVLYDRYDLDAWVDGLSYQGQVGEKCPDDVF